MIDRDFERGASPTPPMFPEPVVHEIAIVMFGDGTEIELAPLDAIRLCMAIATSETGAAS